jgi:hypothetical protein
MAIDFEELLRGEMVEFNWVLDEIGMPKDLFQECWQSIGELEILHEQYKELCKTDKNLTDESPALLELNKLLVLVLPQYQRLEKACPDVSFVCFNALGLSYQCLQDVLDFDLPTDKMRAFIYAAEYRGAAMTFGKTFRAVTQAEQDKPRRIVLSKAGAKGAMARLQRYAELKRWAVEKAGKLGASKDVARRLAAQLPSHLVGVSVEPERLIYETLREKNKPR